MVLRDIVVYVVKWFMWLKVGKWQKVAKVVQSGKSGEKWGKVGKSKEKWLKVGKNSEKC